MPYFALTVAKLEAFAAAEIAISSALITEAAGELGLNVALDVTASYALATAIASLVPIGLAGAGIPTVATARVAAGLLVIPMVAGQAGEVAANAASVA